VTAPDDPTGPDRTAGAAPPAGRATTVSGGQGVIVGDRGTIAINAPTVVEVAGLPAPRPSVETPVHNLPPGSHAFVGRAADLSALAGRLQPTGSGVVVGQAAVHGLGGIGKSELAVRYARTHLHRYPLVWWLTADTPENVTLGLTELTRRLHPVATLADAEAWALGWLQEHTGWLLILDNVEDTGHVTALLGALEGRGHIIITTRRDDGSAAWTRLGLVPLPLGVLDRGASIDLLTRLTGRADPEGADRLADALGDLPLALDQAASYLARHPGHTYDTYRALFTRRLPTAVAHPAAGRQTTVETVWRISLDSIARQSPRAVDLLAVIAWYAPDNIPTDLLDPTADDPDDIAEALAVLASYSVITYVDGAVGVHRLVQAVARATATDTGPDGLPAAAAEAIRLLGTAVPDDPVNNTAGWPRWARLLPHIDAVSSHLPPDHHNAGILYLNDRAATFRQFQGQVADAIPLFEQTLTDFSRVLGDDHPDTLISRNNLALAYQDAGRLDLALPLYERTLADRRRVHGDDHPSTLLSGNSLAGAYLAVGRLDQAIRLYEQTLTARRRVLGEDHPHTLTSRNDLAGVLAIAGRVDQAIALYERSLADHIRILGKDHPHTLSSRNNLAGAYQHAGQLDRAIPRYERTLADRRRVLGDDHPDTLASRNHLASAYRADGRLDEAVALFERTLADRRRVLGDDHPSTLTTSNDLASAYSAAGRIDQAIAIHEQNLADHRRVVGEDHPNTLISRNNLASAYAAAGRIDQAIAIYERLLADARRLLGEDHLLSRSVAENLANARA
jgi:tetratricopeptide (TPR) repeat protein